MVKTFGLVAFAAVAALVLGFGSSLGSSAPKASADTTGVSVVGCESLAAAVDGNITNPTLPADFVTACGPNLLTPTVITNIANVLGDKDGKLEQSDLADLDALDDNQISASCTAPNAFCTLDIFVFVNDQSPVTLDNPSGLINLQNGSEDFTCNLQAAAPPQDNDCLATPTAGNGDGVVVFQDINGTAAAGDVKTVNVTQEAVAQSFDVNVVGPANNVALTLIESTISTSALTAAMNTCQTTTDVTDPAAISNANSTLAVASATDANNRDLTRIPITFSVTPVSASNTIVGLGIGTPGLVTSNTGVTVDPATAGAPTGQYIVLCGGKTTGTATINADIDTADAAGTGAVADHDEKTLNVVGIPANVALTAAPTEIKCDGTQTSTVTAKVTDSAGNNVADGTKVSFSVVALGTANPINTTTTGGTASSTITPLSNASAGVTVIVTAGDSTGEAQSSILVGCTQPLVTQPTAAPVGPSPTPSTGITGPNTGTGGYLGQSSDSGFPMWTLIVLALGSLTLVAGGAVARRAGK